MQLNTNIQSEALPSLFCFHGLFRLIFGRGDHRFYDSLSRLIEADYNGGSTVYNYGYDVAGNLVDYDGVSRTYNAANQMVNDGANTLVYDNNGNLTGNGTDTYTWDRANRLLSVGNHSYVYDGLGNRVQQTVSSVVTDYLNDVQPGLTKLLKQTTGASVEQFVHGPRGIHAVDDGTDWNLYAQDGLGSVRAVVDDMAVVQSSMSFDPYGNPMATYGAGFGFTGEQTDENGSVFLRARYYEPQMGTFIKRDPAETANRYGYVNGNPLNRVDPTGLQGERPEDFVDCVEPLLDRDFPQFIRSCQASCDRDWPHTWQGIQRAACRQGCWGANRYRSLWRNELVDGIYDTLTDNTIYESLIDIDKFVWLSNTVADLVNDNRQDYLYVMNSLLVGLPTTGTLNTAASVFIAGIDAINGLWYSSSDRTLSIGDNGIHCDYRDGTSQQISHHIWSYVSSAAGGIIPNTAFNTGLTFTGVFIHEQIDFGLDGTWQDYLAGVVAAGLGRELGNNRVSPSNFGYVFKAIFELDFCSVMPNRATCTNPSRGERYAYQFLEEDTPLTFGQMVDKNNTGCP